MFKKIWNFLFKRRPKFSHYSGENIEIYTRDGVLHREDGPAMIWKNGDQEWYQFGKRHRDNGLAAVELADGGLEYWKNGYRDRPDHPELPTIIYNTCYQAWHKKGKLHRNDKKDPAVIHPDGRKEYFQNGKPAK